MNLGVRVHDLGMSTAREMAERTSQLGFRYIQLVLHKAINGETGEPGSLSSEKAKNISSYFKDHDIDIALLGAYFNPVHSDPVKVQRSVLKFKEHLKYAPEFSTQYVGTETGSYNNDQWTYNPLNLTEEAFERTKVIFEDLQNTARQYGSFVAVEGSYGHVMSNPKRLKRFFDEVDIGNIKIILDLFNFLNPDNHLDHREIFDECIELFGEDIVIFHLKDYMVKENNLIPVGLGQGLMDFSYIIPLIEKNYPGSYCIFEEVRPVDMKSSIKHILKFSKSNL